MAERKTILITGAAGLLGRHLVADLACANEVHALVHTMHDETTRVPTVHYHACDFGGVWNADSLPRRIHAVVHLAQSSNFRDFPNAAADVFKVNIASTAQLLVYAYKAGAEHFIYASSGGVYASSADALDENAPIKPPSALGYYLSSKLCSEILVQNYAAHMHVQIMRIFFMYGAGQKRSMLLPRLYDNVREGRPITLQGDEGLRINPIHVQDAVGAVEALLSVHESLVCNVAGPKEYSLKEIAEIMGQALGKPPVFEYASGTPQDLLATTETLEKLYRPTRTLENSLADIA